MSTERILCIEDDADTRAVLTIMLGFSDLEAISVPGFEEALPLMKDERFSLYVLDGGLRGISGLSMCERIRAVDPHTPIIIFSGHASPADIERGMCAGANVYLVKPDVAALVPTVKRLLGRVEAASV